MIYIHVHIFIVSFLSFNMDLRLLFKELAHVFMLLLFE